MPTTFDLKVVDLAGYIEETHSVLTDLPTLVHGSQMFLRVLATPDFVSPYQKLMSTTPKVKFELVLDPLLFGCVPRSILPNLGLLLMTGVLGWKFATRRALDTIDDLVQIKRQKIVRIKTH